MDNDLLKEMFETGASLSLDKHQGNVVVTVDNNKGMMMKASFNFKENQDNLGDAVMRVIEKHLQNEKEDKNE